MVYQRWREHGVRTAHSIRPPPHHWVRLGFSEKIGIGLVQWRPTAVSLPDIHLEELA
jgi:hypothetical protein